MIKVHICTAAWQLFLRVPSSRVATYQILKYPPSSLLFWRFESSPPLALRFVFPLSFIPLSPSYVESVAEVVEFIGVTITILTLRRLPIFQNFFDIVKRDFRKLELMFSFTQLVVSPRCCNSTWKL